MKKHVLLLLALFASVSLLHASIVTGTCGDNLTWSYNTESHALVIEGSGAMYNYGGYNEDERPWETVASSITSLSLPDGLTSIGRNAFIGCGSLTHIDIPNSVTSIGNLAFQGCYNLVTAYIGNGVTSIGYYAFRYCQNLTSIDIPNSVTSIGGGAFAYCYGLTSIEIPNGVTNIEEAAFMRCDNLTSVIIGNSVTSIKLEAFEGCDNLTSVIIGNSVISIESESFSGCSSLTSVTIPSSVTSIGEWAFPYCIDITMKSTTPPTIMSNSFNSSALIHVPCNSVSTYQAATVWQFLNIVGSMDYDFHLSATNGGSTQITNSVCQANTVVVEAMPNEGYRFTGWSDGNTDNPRTIVLTEDKDITAQFKIITYSVNLTGVDYGTIIVPDLISDNLPYDGSIVWGDFWGDLSGEVPANSEISFDAVLHQNCTDFISWSDGITDSHRWFNLTHDTTIYAIYSDVETYQVSITAGEHGYLNNEFVGTRTSCDDNIYVRAYADDNCHFVGWSDGGNYDEEYDYGVDRVYYYRYINIVSDTTITALFAEDVYYQVNLSGVTSGYISGYGEFNGNWSGSLRDNTYIEINGHHEGCGAFESWSDGVTDSYRELYVTQDTTISAIISGVETYQVSITAGEHGYLNNEFVGTRTSCDGEIYVRAYADDSCHFVGWSDGGDYSVGYDYDYDSERSYYYRYVSVYSDTTITALFEKDVYYQVNISGAIYGYISNYGEFYGNWSGSLRAGTRVSFRYYYDYDYERCGTFEGWSDGVMDNNREIIITRDTTVSAIVTGIETYQVSITAGEHGYLSNEIVGTHTTCDDNICVAAYADEGYHFVRWSDGYNSFNRCLNINSDTTIYAIFDEGEFGGALGENVFWSYDDNSQVMTISGSGEMQEWYSFVEHYNWMGESEIIWSAIQNTEFVIIENGVTSISGNLFKNFYNLQYIAIPTSLQKIGAYAFEDCSNLTSFVLPNTVTEVGYRILSGSGVANPVYNNTLFAYMPESASGSYTVPAGIQTICGGAFSTCSNLTSVTIPNGVTSIGEGAFYRCDGLTSIALPNSIASIGRYAFEYCDGLTSIELPNSITSIGNGAFYGCHSLKALEFPSSLEYLERYMFYDCNSLETIKIPSSVLSYGEYYRLRCENGETTDDCYEEYFAQHTCLAGEIDYDGRINSETPLPNLKHVEAPAWLFDVPEWGWTDCPKYLDTVVVNSGELNDNVLGVIARSYKTLKMLDVAGVSNTTLADEAFYNNYNLTALALPANLTSVSYMAAAGCKNLQTITIPAPVEVIEQSAFEDCRSLASVTFAGADLTTIGSWAFYNCHALTSIEIPAGVTEIGAGAFYGCTYLNNVIVPSSVQSIGDNAFALCSRMQQMQVRAAVPPSIASKTFDEVSRQMPVYVPQNSVNAYKADPLWGQMNIIGADEQWSSVDNITTTTTPTKQLINGQLYLHHGDRIYDAQGRQVK